MKKFSLAFIVSIFIFSVSMAHAQKGTLTVEISGINDPKGLMSIGLYAEEKGFPDKGEEYRGKDVDVTSHTIVHTFKEVPFGTYTVAIYHDINSNGKLDKNFLGIPKESYAFSNNVFGALGLPPGFDKASFEFAEDKTIKIKIE